MLAWHRPGAPDSGLWGRLLCCPHFWKAWPGQPAPQNLYTCLPFLRKLPKGAICLQFMISWVLLIVVLKSHETDHNSEAAVQLALSFSQCCQHSSYYMSASLMMMMPRLSFCNHWPGATAGRTPGCWSQAGSPHFRIIRPAQPGCSNLCLCQTAFILDDDPDCS